VRVHDARELSRAKLVAAMEELVSLLATAMGFPLVALPGTIDAFEGDAFVSAQTTAPGMQAFACFARILVNVASSPHLNATALVFPFVWGHRVHAAAGDYVVLRLSIEDAQQPSWNYSHWEKDAYGEWASLVALD
jgi:hypothetical protein